MAPNGDGGERPDEEAAREVAFEGSDFVGLLEHFYRGELGRVTAWRARLDRTTNWAVGLMATLITWAFSAADHPHYIILGSLGIVIVFLLVEARRYRTYDIWRSRVRLVEENVFANAADPAGASQPGWRELLAEDLRRPRHKIRLHEALIRRLRRVYFPLVTIIVASWFFRVSLFPPADVGIREAAAINSIPGELVIAGVLLVYLSTVVLVVWPIERQAKGRKRGSEGWEGAWR